MPDINDVDYTIDTIPDFEDSKELGLVSNLTEYIEFLKNLKWNIQKRIEESKAIWRIELCQKLKDNPKLLESLIEELRRVK